LRVRTFLAAGQGFLYAQDPEKIVLQHLRASFFGRALSLGSSLTHRRAAGSKFSDCHHFIQQRRNSPPAGGANLISYLTKRASSAALRVSYFN
jgi:hypothetical protein